MDRRRPGIRAELQLLENRRRRRGSAEQTPRLLPGESLVEGEGIGVSSKLLPSLRQRPRPHRPVPSAVWPAAEAISLTRYGPSPAATSSPPSGDDDPSSRAYSSPSSSRCTSVQEMPHSGGDAKRAAPRTPPASVMSPLTAAMPRSSSFPTVSSDRARPETWCPAARSASAIAAPTYPVAAVTSTSTSYPLVARWLRHVTGNLPDLLWVRLLVTCESGYKISTGYGRRGLFSPPYFSCWIVQMVIWEAEFWRESFTG
jgi:hypothetical protein